jgi:uncharacterized membrane protein
MGFLLAILSTILQTSRDLVSKRLSFLIDGTSSTFASFFYALPIYFVIFVVLEILNYESINFSYHFLVLVLLRSIADAGAEWTKMQALACGEISLIAPFFSLAPIFLLFLSPLITGDKLTVGAIIAVLCCVAGSLTLITKPEIKESKVAMRGVVLGLMSSFFFALNSCFDRLTVQVANPFFSGFAMTFVAALFFAPSIIFNRKRISEIKNANKPLILRGVLEVGFMVSRLSALVFLQAPYVAAISRLSLLLSIIGGHMIFKEQDFSRRVSASILIIIGALVVLLE